MAETETLLALLKRHYIKPGAPMPGGIFLPEVGQNGSWGASSRCDAIYVGFTSASGRLLVGHELKVSRADWLAELNKPGKADAWADECHEWWLVTTPGVVHDGELPDGWGHMVPGRSKTRMRVVQKPRRHSDRTPSWDAVRSVMARQDTLRSQEIAAARTKAHQDAWAEVDRLTEDAVERRMRSLGDVSTLQAELDSYRRALGGRLVAPDANGSIGWRFRGQHTEADLADLAALLRLHRDLEAAARQLAGQYSPLRSLRDAFDDLDKALQSAASITPAAPATDRGDF